MSNLQRLMEPTNAELRRLHSAANDREAALAIQELTEKHLPALESEDETIGAAARATMRWMQRERSIRALARIEA